MTRVGHGFDAHRLVEGRTLVLGGVTVPFEKGALGHSDADVLAHAISDALLGAAALGDLGAHFPDSDPQWKDADSMVLLEACGSRVRDGGYRIVNIDATVVVDRPKLAAYTPAMRQHLAARLQLALECVSVKAKTSEGMGYTGDGSGIAAYAVAAIERS
jgi:2-C-methyl-D-erythritol 2,4-cyclodiphosphate synthase